MELDGKGSLPLNKIQLFVSLVGCLCLETLGATVAEATKLAPSALTLVEVGWKTSQASFESAPILHDKLRSAAPHDLRASYALDPRRDPLPSVRRCSQLYRSGLGRLVAAGNSTSGKKNNLILRRFLADGTLETDFREAIQRHPIPPMLAADKTLGQLTWVDQVAIRTRQRRMAALISTRAAEPHSTLPPGSGTGLIRFIPARSM